MAASQPIASASESPRTVRIQRAYKTELDPNNKQRTLLLKSAGVARFAFNWALQRSNEQYAATGKRPRGFDLQKQLCEIKDEQFPWMREVSKWAPASAIRDLDAAFQCFFERLKCGEKPGFPRFKSRRNGIGGFRCYENIKTASRSIHLPKLGWIRVKEKCFLPNPIKILSATISERAGRWFVSVQVEEEITVPENQGAAIGIDLGLTSLVTCSDGRKWGAPKPLVRSLEKYRRLSRRHSRKQKGSANRKKSAAKLARLHYRIACQRGDYLHKLTATLAKAHSVIAVESLNVSGMLRNRKLSRSINDAAWSELLRQLAYKCEWYGSKLIEADRFFPSTKTCSGCGAIREMLLSDRTYYCDSCGLEMDRDVNAAKNLLNLYTASSAGSACGGDSLELPLKQEPSSATCA